VMAKPPMIKSVVDSVNEMRGQMSISEAEKKAPTACFGDPIWTLFRKTDEQFKRITL